MVFSVSGSESVISGISGISSRTGTVISSMVFSASGSKSVISEISGISGISSRAGTLISSMVFSVSGSESVISGISGISGISSIIFSSELISVDELSFSSLNRLFATLFHWSSFIISFGFEAVSGSVSFEILNCERKSISAGFEMLSSVFLTDSFSSPEISNCERKSSSSSEFSLLLLR